MLYKKQEEVLVNFVCMSFNSTNTYWVPSCVGRQDVTEESRSERIQAGMWGIRVLGDTDTKYTYDPVR